MAKYRIAGTDTKGRQIMADVEAGCALDITTHLEEWGFNSIAFILTEEQAKQFDENMAMAEKHEAMRVEGLSLKLNNGAADSTPPEGMLA